MDLKSVQEECSEPKPTLRLYLATFLVCFASVAMGGVLGYTSPALPSMQKDPRFADMTEDEASWIGSLVNVGALTGSLLSGSFVSFLGPKRTVNVASVPMAAGWTVIATARNVASLYAGRFVTGFCVGVFCGTVPVYISEISTPKVRGTLVSCFQLSVCVGVAAIYGAGIGLDWIWTAVVEIIPLAVLAISLLFLPESPNWLIKKKRKGEALKSLEWLRGRSGVVDLEKELDQEKQDVKQSASHDDKKLSPFHERITSFPFIDDEKRSSFDGKLTLFDEKPDSFDEKMASFDGKLTLFDEKQSSYNAKQSSFDEKPDSFDEKHEEHSFLSYFFRRDTTIPLVITLFVMFFQQLSGINAVIFYTSRIFADAGMDDPAVASLVTGIMQVTGTGASIFVVDRLGRKKLLYVSGLGMTISLVVLGLYFKMAADAHEVPRSIPLVCLVVYIVSFAVGFGPIPWLLMSEILTVQETKATACGIASSFNWTLAFVVTKCFSTMLEGLGPHGTYWFFAAICLFGVVFVFFFTFETKGKSLQQIRDHYAKKPN